MTRARPDSTQDDGGIVLGWLVKLVVVFAIVGVVLFDGIAITYSRVTAADDARTVARAASDAMILDKADEREAVQIAVERANDRGIELDPKKVKIAQDGSVTVTVHRDVPTVVVHRIGPISQYASVDETYSTPAID